MALRRRNHYHGSMAVTAAIVGALIVAGVLLEAFESVVLPRRVTRRFRFTRGFYPRWRSDLGSSSGAISS